MVFSSHNCPLAFDLLEFSNSSRLEAKWSCQAGTAAELKMVAELKLSCWHRCRSTKAEYHDGGALLSDEFGTGALPFLGDGG